jgi:beta-glucosidase
LSRFFWGVANSAFQVEGSPAPSDWKSWTESPGKIADDTTAQDACDFWNRYPEDFSHAKNLGATAFRLSIAWDRCEPREGEWDFEALNRYKKIIHTCQQQGMTPLLTLHHFVLPQWLAQKGGLLSSEFPEAFARYAEKIVSLVNHSSETSPVTHWITFNEPNVLVHFAYIEGLWPPGEKNSLDHWALAQAHMAEAHLLAVPRMRQASPGPIQIGIAQHWRVFQSHNSWNPISHLACWISTWTFNRQFINSIQSGSIFFWRPGSTAIRKNLSQFKNNKNLDFLGINYYGRLLVKLISHAPFAVVEEGPGVKSDLGWEIFPNGLHLALKEAFEISKVPLIVTENGLADQNDSRRPQALADHIQSLGRARASGIPVQGYLHWSLTDNFEWSEGLKPRFGLIDINYQTQERNPRPSFHVFAQIIRQYPDGP